MTTIKTLSRVSALFLSISIACGCNYAGRTMPGTEECPDSTLNVSVPVSGDWMFSSTEKAVLHAEVTCGSRQKIRLETVLVSDLSLMSEVKDTVLKVSTTARCGKEAQTDVAINLGTLAPGFYKVCVSYTDRNGNSGQVEPFNIGCDPESIVSEPDAAADFDGFWKSNLAELAAEPMNIKMKLMREYSSPERNVYRVEINSLDGVKMGGIYAEPVAAGRYPAYIEYMGYGADVYPYHGGDRPDAIQFLVSVRDQGIFRDLWANDRKWIDRGLEARDTYYYKGAFCDAVRAVDFIASREKTDTSRIFGLGESQGGALTWIAASLDNRFRAIAPAVPFLSDYRDYSKIVWWPMWEVFEAAEQAGIDHETLFGMMSYFDVKNFTGRIECPVMMGFGLQDPTCPPHTNFAGYNQVRTEKSWKCYPLCGHGIWQVKEWAAERDAWLSSFESRL